MTQRREDTANFLTMDGAFVSCIVIIRDTITILIESRITAYLNSVLEPRPITQGSSQID